MEHAATRFKDWLVIGAVPLVVLGALPLLALTAFVVRPVVLFAAAAALLAGAVLHGIGGRARVWIDGLGAAEVGYRGLRLAPDLAYDRGHAWASFTDDIVVIGVDDLLAALLGPVVIVELPPDGHRVRRGDRLFRLRSARRSLDVAAPVSGTVIGSNARLPGNPGLVSEHPYTEGWAVRLRGEATLAAERRLLLRGRRARDWFRRDVDDVLGAGPPTAGDAALPETVVSARGLHERLDDATWERTAKRLFSPGTRE